MLKFSSYRYCLLLFNAFTLTALLTVLYFLLHTVLNGKWKLGLSRQGIILYAFLFCICFFFSSFGIAETWFWLIQVCTYLWSLIAIITIFTILLQERIVFWHWPVLIISAVLIGGCSESYAVMTLLLGAVLFFSLRGRERRQRRQRRWVVASVIGVLLISFAITASAPGNAVRSSQMPPPAPVRFVFIQLKEFTRLLLLRLPLISGYLVMLSLPWFLLGLQISNKERLTPSQVKKRLVRIVIGSVTFIFITLLPTSYFLSELAPDRGLSMISFVLCMVVGYGFFMGGQLIERETARERGLLGGVLIVYLLFSGGVLVNGLVVQTNIARTYDRAYDERNALLLKLEKEGRKDVVSVAPLPPSGMLYSFEISDDTTDFRNTHLKMGLGLHFSVVRGK